MLAESVFSMFFLKGPHHEYKNRFNFLAEGLTRYADPARFAKALSFVSREHKGSTLILRGVPEARPAADFFKVMLPVPTTRSLTCIASLQFNIAFQTVLSSRSSFSYSRAL